jgi:hypothetical protein
MFRFAAAFMALATAFGAQAAPTVRFDPTFDSVVVGQTFELELQGLFFDRTASGAVIDKLTGGQNLSFSFDADKVELLKVVIDPRWTYAPGNKPGTIDNGAGTLTKLAFADYPALAETNFNIATFTLKALKPGDATLALLSGQFVGKVGTTSAASIGATLGRATVHVSSVPEPGHLALMLAGLGCIGFRLHRRRTPA